MNKDTILLRLVDTVQEKVVGYQKQENGLIYQDVDLNNICEPPIVIKRDITKLSLGDNIYYCNYYIPHDRADRYVMTLEDGTMVFERDEIILDDDIKCIIEFNNGAYDLIGSEQSYGYLAEWEDDYSNLKVTGIQGVNNEED